MILLTSRQRFVVNALEIGLSQREISARLGVTESRVSQILGKIKLDVRTVDLDQKLEIDWITL